MSDSVVLIAKHVIKLEVHFSDLRLLYEKKEKKGVKSLKWLALERTE